MVELAQLGSNSVIIVAGPTASGKSALALQLAQKYILKLIVNLSYLFQIIHQLIQ